MELIDALKELLHREWGDTAEVRFILECVEDRQEEALAIAESTRKLETYMKSFDSFIEKITKAK